VNCSSCGHENPAQAKFRLECGSRLGHRCVARSAESYELFLRVERAELARLAGDEPIRERELREGTPSVHRHCAHRDGPPRPPKGCHHRVNTPDGPNAENARTVQFVAQ